MATDIYLSKGVIEQFSSNAIRQGDYLVELWHNPCSTLVREFYNKNEETMWPYMEAMLAHSRECPLSRRRKG